MAFVSTLLQGIGTGLGIFGQFDSARQYEQTAQLNALIGTANAQSQRDATLGALRIQGLGTRLSLDEARINARLGLADAEMRRRNAERLEAFAEARTTQGRETVRRARRNFEELAGRQMAAVASSGVLASGSPLDVMADTAQQMALSLADLWDETSMERAEALAVAGQERFAADMGRASTLAGLAFARSSARIDRAGLAAARAAAQGQYRAALFGAKMGLAAGQDAARGSMLAGLGGIFAGGAQLLGDSHTNRRLGT